MADCDYVLHTASPFPAAAPRDEDEVIKPAVEGTLSVLRACADSGTVKRVVLTSSCSAIYSGNPSTQTYSIVGYIIVVVVNNIKI